jgi:hypothetical protein
VVEDTKLENQTGKDFVELSVMSKDGAVHRNNTFVVAVTERSFQRGASPSQLGRSIDAHDTSLLSVLSPVVL